MSKGGRFGRIARDLEKLPCELIEPVIEDLELEQLIRVSQFGGPRVTWSVENSPTWSYYFRDNRLALNELLALTDEIVALCYAPGTFKSKTTSLRFWFLRSSRSNVADIRKLRDTATFALLANTWTAALCGTLRDVMGDSLQHDFLDYATFLLRPSGSIRTCHTEEADFFRKTVDSIFYAQWTASSPVPEAATVARWVAIYKKVSHTRISAQATELLRLADLHEKHASRLKKPWAPQTRRRNTKHIVGSLRREAVKLQRGNGRRWHGNEPSKYRFTHAFAALVPYDWCLRLVCLVMGEHPLPAEGYEEGIYPKEMVEMVAKVIDGLPSFYDVAGERTLDPTKIETLRTANTPWSLPPKVDEKESTFLTLRERKRRVIPHSETELSWLEAFVEVVAWMEERFPSLVNEARGEEWDKGDDIEAAIRRREHKRQKKSKLKIQREAEATNLEDFGLKESLRL